MRLTLPVLHKEQSCIVPRAINPKAPGRSQEFCFRTAKVVERKSTKKNSPKNKSPEESLGKQSTKKEFLEEFGGFANSEYPLLLSYRAKRVYLTSSIRTTRSHFLLYLLVPVAFRSAINFRKVSKKFFFFSRKQDSCLIEEIAYFGCTVVEIVEAGVV